MAFSGSQVTRIGLYGGTRSPYGAFTGKALAPPVFSGTIPDVSYSFDSGNQITDYSTYFTGATSYSISPVVETGWGFDTITGILTVDTDDSNTFGPYTITGTNLSGSDSSNAFSITVNAAIAEIVGGGGWAYAYEDEILKRKAKRKELDELEEKAKKIQDKLDRELALELKKELEDQERVNELNRLAKLAQKHETDVIQLGDRVEIAYNRAILSYNYSAMEALERTIRQAKEEEEWLIQITMELINE